MVVGVAVALLPPKKEMVPDLPFFHFLPFIHFFIFTMCFFLVARGVEITQILCENLATISRTNCKTSGISARLAQKELRVLGQRSLLKIS
jgi:hypothetical protein